MAVATARMYRPVIETLLVQCDRRLERRGDLAAALSDRTLEVLSRIEIDWSADLDALEAEFKRRDERGAFRVRSGAPCADSTNV